MAENSSLHHRAPANEFFHGFEGTTGNALPAGWTRTGTAVTGIAAVSGAWTTVASGQDIAQGVVRQAHSGTRMVASLAWGMATPTNAWLFTPAIEVRAGVTYEINFWYMIPRITAYGVPIPANSFRVAIGTGPSEAEMDVATALFTTNTHADDWTFVSVQFTATETGYIHIGFNDFSPVAQPGNGFALFVDDISFGVVRENDLMISGIAPPALTIPARIPVHQIAGLPQSEISLSATVENIGLNPQTNITMTAEFDGVSVGTFTPHASLAPQATHTFDGGRSLITLPVELGPVEVTFTVDQAQTDDDLEDNTATALVFTGTRDIYRMDELVGVLVNSFVPDVANFYGHVFAITAPTILDRISVAGRNQMMVGAGNWVSTVAIFRLNSDGTIPDEPMYSFQWTLVVGQYDIFTLPLPQPVMLTPGNYFVAVSPSSTGINTAPNHRVFLTDLSDRSSMMRVGNSPNLTPMAGGAMLIGLFLPEETNTVETPIALAVTPSATSVSVNFSTSLAHHVTVFNTATGRPAGGFSGDAAGGPTRTVYIANLTEGTQYTARVVSIGGVLSTAGAFPAQRSTWVEQTFTTGACQTITTLPWTENFDGLLFPSNCWNVHRENPNVVATWSRSVFQPRPGSLAHAALPMIPMSDDEQTSWLVTPAIAIPATGIHELSLWARWQAPANNNYTGVWVSTTTNEIGAFVELEEMLPGGLPAWQERAISLEQFAGQTIYLAFKYVSRGVGLLSTPWEIDDIRVAAADIRIISMTPTNNATDIATDQDIVITFNQDITSTNLDAITVVPTVSGLNTTIVNRTLTISHSGFQYGTTYNITIPAGTIEGLDQPITLSFRTEPFCETITTLPWTENFASTIFAPDCWVLHRENLAIAATWTRNATSPITGTSAQARHAAPAAADGVQTSWLITPPITIPATEIYELLFNTRWGIPANIGYTGVWVSTTSTDISEFVELQELFPDGLTAWQQRAISLEQFAGQTIYLAFKYVGRGVGLASTTWDVSNLLINRAPLRVVTITPAGNMLNVEVDQDIVVTFNMDVTYTSLAGITISPNVAGFTPTFTDNRTLTITHDNFDYATVYIVTIPAGTVVGINEEIVWMFRATPQCAPITTFPWTENFGVVANFPAFFPNDCWTLVTENPAIAAVWLRSTVTPVDNTSANARHGAPVVSADVQTSWLISPAIEIPATGVYDLKFWTRWVVPANNGNTAVWVSTTSTDIGEFVELQELLPGGLASWQEKIVSLEQFSGQTIYLAFRYVGRGVGLSSTAWDVSNVRVALRPILATETVPSYDQTDVPQDTDIVVTFNQPVTFLGDAGITIEPAVAGVSASFENNTTLIITHDGFAPATLHRVTLADNVIADFAGTTWAFTTDGFPDPDFPDPLNLAVNVVGNTATVTWSHELTGSAIGSFRIFLTDLTTPYATNLNDTAFVFANLSTGSHTVGVQAVGPTGLLSNIRPIAFTIAPPAIVTQTPVVDTIGVATDAVVTVTFDHDIIVAGNLAGITFSPAVSGISATIENGNVLTITHDGFSYATVYTITIPAGTIVHVNHPISWSFRTEPLCDPILAFPYTQGFEGAMFPPDCWRIVREELDRGTWALNASAPLRPGSSNHMRHSFIGAGQTSFLMTRAITVPSDGFYEFSFWTRTAWTRPEFISEVWVSTTTNEPEEFELLYRLDLPNSYNANLTPWRNVLIALDEFRGETIYIAFRYSGTNAHVWDIDDVSIRVLPVRVASRTPEINEQHVSPNTVVTVVFNQPVTAVTTPITGIVFNPPVDGVLATIEDGHTLTITHDGFDFNQTYSVTIPLETITDFNEIISWSFTTHTEEISVVAKNPENGTTNVAIDADIVVTFNQPVAVGNLNLIQIQPSVANVQAEIVGRDLVISHGGFAFGETYTVTLPVGTIAGFNEAVSWSFEAFSPPRAPWLEDFETTAGIGFPAGWTGSNTTWRTVGSAVYAHSGERMLVSAYADGGPAWVFSEGILLTEGTTYMICFMFVAPGFRPLDEPDNFRVRIGTGQTSDEMVETVFEQSTTVPTFETDWTRALHHFTPQTTGLFYLGFERLHPSGTGYAIRIDDVSIEVAVPYDLEIIATFPYTQIPTSQFATVSAQARNIGTATQTNVALSATLNSVSIGESTPIATLAPLATSPMMTVVPTTPITEGAQTMVLTVEGNQATGANNTATFQFTATENVFARDALTAPTATGFGFDPPGGTLATVFEITQATYLSAIQVLFANSAGTVQYTVSVFPMTGPMTASTTAIASRTQNRVPGLVTIDFSDDDIELVPGRYAVAITATSNFGISHDGRGAQGVGFYTLTPATGELTYNVHSQFGAVGLRLVIADVEQLPGQVTLTAPANNAKDVSITPTLTWTAPTSGGEVVEYFVYLGETATTLVRIAELPATETSFAVAPALPYNTTHYWRIVASNAQGEGEPSATWNFTTIDEEPTSLVETGRAPSLQVFPNPVTDGYFYIEADDMRQIEIIDMLGRTVMQKNVNSSRERVDIPNLREGLYVVRVTTATGRTLVRIVVQ